MQWPVSCADDLILSSKLFYEAYGNGLNPDDNIPLDDVPQPRRLTVNRVQQGQGQGHQNMVYDDSTDDPVTGTLVSDPGYVHPIFVDQ